MSAASVLNIPPIVRNKAIAAGAQAWLDDLPFVIGELEREWEFVIGEVFTGGTEALVAEATLSDGTGAVLKVMVERAGDHARNEIAVLRFADGQGCCRLLRCDESRGAILVERLGRSLSELACPSCNATRSWSTLRRACGDPLLTSVCPPAPKKDDG